MSFITETAFAGSSLADRFGALRAKVTAAVAKRKVYTQTMRELDNLSDRELADLGISRSNIKRIATVSAYGA